MKNTRTTRHPRDLQLGVLSAGVLLLSAACSSRPREIAEPGAGFEQGEALYMDHCAACHGTTGRGDGSMAAYLRVAPRNFRLDSFRFISASWGGMATQDDVERFIRRGSRPSLMPGHPHLSSEHLTLVADYVRELRRLGVMDEIEDSFLEEDEDYTIEDLEEIATERMESVEPVAVPARSIDYRASSARGAELFAENCASCHGPSGRGDGSEELVDNNGRTIQARDLTRGEYRGGGRDRDLFWRIRCGIPGTPMPALEAAIVADDDVWQIVDYVRFLAVPK